MAATEVEVRAAVLAENEILKLYNDTGFDLTTLPPIATSQELARALNVSVGSLSRSLPQPWYPLHPGGPADPLRACGSR